MSLLSRSNCQRKPAGHKMAIVLLIKPRLSVSTTFGDHCWIFCITLSIIPYFSSRWDGGFATLDTHNFSATVEGDRDRAAMLGIQLSLINICTPRWEACRTIRIASDRIPPKLTVSFWSHLGREGTEEVRICVKEAIFCGKPRVSRQTLLCCK